MFGSLILLVVAYYLLLIFMTVVVTGVETYIEEWSYDIDIRKRVYKCCDIALKCITFLMITPYKPIAWILKDE